MQPPKYRHRRAFVPQDFDLDLEMDQDKGGFRDLIPYVFGGAMLVAAFAFAGHQLGRNADAHTAGPDIEVPAAAQTAAVTAKGSLLVEGDSFELMGLNALRRQTVMSDGKGDMAVMDAGEAPAPEVVPNPSPVLKPIKKVAKLADERRLKIEPASFNAGEATTTQKPSLKKLAVAPKPDDIEDSFKLPKAEKQKIVAQRRVRMAEENCLARAVYFEARSESALGQMAVAKVILNRVKSPNYPKTICGVVYQGTQRRNSCQFSFACDGQPDDVRSAAAWGQAKSIAQRAIAGDMNLGKGMSTATSYHADYVNPRWASKLRKISRIGNHIFYSGF